MVMVMVEVLGLVQGLARLPVAWVGVARELRWGRMLPCG